MTREEMMKILDIESEEDFMYFDQFAALMETEEEIDYDMFTELLLLAGPETLPDLLSSFFEDVIRGIPDDNTDLYAAVQSQKDALISLSGFGKSRGFGFLADELYRFREWYLAPGSVICTPEGGGEEKHLSPCEAFTLFVRKNSPDRNISMIFRKRCLRFRTTIFWTASRRCRRICRGKRQRTGMMIYCPTNTIRICTTPLFLRETVPSIPTQRDSWTGTALS